MGTVDDDETLSPSARRDIEAAERFLADIPGWTGWLAESTKESYKREIGRYLITAEELRFPRWPITPRHVIQHIDRLWTMPGTKGRPTSPRTVFKAVAALNRIATKQREKHPELPIVITESVKERMIKYEVDYSDAGYGAIIADEIPLRDLMAMAKQIDRNTLRGMRDACAFTLAIGMGCRSAELVAISLPDIKRVNERGAIPIRVHRAKNDRKGKGRDCYVEPVDGMLELCPHVALEDYLEALKKHGHEQGPLFISMRGSNPNLWPRKVTRMSRVTFSTWVAELAVAAGIPPGQYSAHSLRRTAIRVMRRGGVEVDVIADHVGHRNLETTRRYTGTVAYEEGSPMRAGMEHAAQREGL
jgi:integrase